MKPMLNKKTTLIGFSLIFLAGCTTFETQSTKSSSQNTLKTKESFLKQSYITIYLNGTKYSEEEYGSFEIWECSEYLGSNKVLLEVGYFGSPDLSNFGFILYDGSSSGDLTFYQREGVNKRWDWETTAGSFSFVIKPDGTGYYYDFTDVPEGEKIKSSDIYTCIKK